MVKYALFSGEHYYPSGGAKDLVGVYDTLEAAMDGGPISDWAHIARLDDDGLTITHELRGIFAQALPPPGWAYPTRRTVQTGSRWVPINTPYREDESE